MASALPFLGRPVFRVTLTIAQTCPWVDHLVERYGANVKLLQCVPQARRGGTSALAKVEVPSGSPERIRRSVAELPSVEDAEFVAVRPGVYLGMVTTTSCPCGATALPHTNVLQAVALGDGRLRWTLLAYRREDLDDLVRSLRERGVRFVVESVKRFRGSWSLTGRQEQFLRAALDLGFYDVPRRIELKDLARLFGVSPTAASEVLRRAHGRLVSDVVREFPA